MFLAPWNRSGLKKKGAGAALKKSQESEPLKKTGSSAMREDKNLKSIRKFYFSYSSLGR